MKKIFALFVLTTFLFSPQLASQAKLQIGISNTVNQINKFPEFSAFKTGGIEIFDAFTPGISVAMSIFDRNFRLHVDGLFSNISSSGESNINYTEWQTGNSITRSLQVRSKIEYTVFVEYELFKVYANSRTKVFLNSSFIHSRSDYLRYSVTGDNVGNLDADILATSIAVGPELIFKINNRSAIQIYAPFQLYQINTFDQANEVRFVQGNGLEIKAEDQIFPPNFSLRVGVIYDLIK